MEEQLKKGPFVLEVKKNGNVILYEDKTKNIIWQTNTANKGIGPSYFYITNNKNLILEDSNKKILYKYDNYREVTTIYFADNKDEIHKTNGLILQFGE